MNFLQKLRVISPSATASSANTVIGKEKNAMIRTVTRRDLIQRLYHALKKQGRFAGCFKKECDDTRGAAVCVDPRFGNFILNA
ncbi:hypothetical protein V5799_004613 [Amblyomma americanum]|uniref:Uncharacterized protein n=1 Tax=Amblyomma americanum TaxID=6943 RepID=A0AAQ4D5L3_AMBAM